MPELYVIVHENCVTYSTSNADSKNVKNEISKIKREKAFILLEDNPNELHPDMPLPDERLKVFVCGAFWGGKKWCVNKQLKLLKKTGYDVQIDYDASLKHDYDLEERLKRIDKIGSLNFIMTLYDL